MPISFTRASMMNRPSCLQSMYINSLRWSILYAVTFIDLAFLDIDASERYFSHSPFKIWNSCKFLNSNFFYFLYGIVVFFRARNFDLDLAVTFPWSVTDSRLLRNSEFVFRSMLLIKSVVIILSRRYLNMAMDDKIIRSQDTCSVIEHIAGNPKGRELAYNFVIKHWKTLYKRSVIYAHPTFLQ